MTEIISDEELERLYPEAEHEDPATRIGPDSLLEFIALDKRTNFSVPPMALQQVMIAPVGAGVMQHSRIFEHTLERLHTSGELIARSISGPNAVGWALYIRDLHKKIMGIDENGDYYHALNHRIFGTTAESFFEMYRHAHDEFMPYGELNFFELCQLHDEKNAWFLRFGYGRPLTSSYIAHDIIWRKTKQEFQETEAYKWGMDQILSKKIKPPEMPQYLKPIWSLGGQIAVGELLKLTAIGGMPEEVRERFNMPWSASDRIEYEILKGAVRNIGQLLPANKRYMPVAYTALKKLM